MLSLRKLMTNTPSDVVQRARQTTAVVMAIETKKSKEMNTLFFKIKCRGHTDTQYYEVLIELYPEEHRKNTYEKVSFDNPAWVKCSCPFFRFNVEYALAKAGSSELDYIYKSLDGSPNRLKNPKPAITNPREIPYLCKHLYKASPAAVKQAEIFSKKQKGFKFV